MPLSNFVGALALVSSVHVQNAAMAPPAGSFGSSSGGNKISIPFDFEQVRLAHGIIASTAFVNFMPFGAMAIRTLHFKGLIWIHAGWMMFAYIMALAALGMGVWVAVTIHKLNDPHVIIGIIVIGSLLLQSLTGLVHHLLYKRSGRANGATYPHIWWGRAIITLAMINGGLGLQLAWPYQKNTKTGAIVYGAVAGTVWMFWMTVIAVAFVKSRGEKEAGERVCSHTGPDGEKGSVTGTNHSDAGSIPVRQLYAAPVEIPLSRLETAL